MTYRIRATGFLLTVLVSTAAHAQSTPGTDAPETQTPGSESAAATRAHAGDEKVGLLQGKLESLEEQFAETKTDVLGLKKLKFSGYVQARYVNADHSLQGVDARGSPSVKDGFTVRRARLKGTYTSSWSSLVLQIDASPKGVALRDAEAHLIEPWTGHHLEFVLGQMKLPFGYEVVQSSSKREFPERSRVVRAFAAGERDRGLKLSGSIKSLRFAVGALDGNGIENKTFPGLDNDQNKDVVGQVGFDMQWIAGGASAWYGETFQPGDFTVSPAVSGKTHPRTRLGADLQIYLDVLPIGGTALKGEFIAGTTWSKDGVEQFGVPALGWYGLVAQNIGLQNLIAIRYDHFDGVAGTADGVDAKDPTKPAGNNSIGTLGVAFTHYWDDALKVSAAYEVPMTRVVEGAVDPKDNQFTLQLQATF
jgi:hypothetical protein